ncbi:E3 ubiquitin-protein ligase rnf13 [Gurleya vavrai]
MIKYYYYFYHLLVTKFNSKIDSNFIALKDAHAEVLKHHIEKETPWTIVMYPRIDIYAPFTIVTDAPVTLLIDFKPELDYKLLIELYEKDYKIKNIIFLNSNDHKEIFMIKENLESINHLIITLDAITSKNIIRNYSPELVYICKANCLSKIQLIFIISFYFILISFLIVLYMTLRIYMNVRTKKDPVITDHELDNCPILLYRNVKDKMFEQCLVCMDDYKQDDSVRVLLCSHFFHSNCVDPWLKNKSARCPYCRKLIKLDV